MSSVFSTVESWYVGNRSRQLITTAFRPAYVAQFAPVLNAIVAQHKVAKDAKQVKILVIGSGDGTFTKHILPYLDANGRDIKVVESDASPVVKKVPKESAAVQADMTRLPFTNEVFDLVVSECALHMLPRNRLKHALTEIKRVLKPGASVINVEDNASHNWDDPNELAEYAGDNDRLNELNKRRFNSALKVYARRLGMAHHLTNLNGSFVTTLNSPEVEHIKEYFKPRSINQANSFHFNGVTSGYFDPSLPKGNVYFSYQGQLSVLTKPVREIKQLD